MGLRHFCRVDHDHLELSCNFPNPHDERLFSGKVFVATNSVADFPVYCSNGKCQVSLSSHYNEEAATSMSSRKPLKIDADAILRRHLLVMLRGEGAHQSFDEVIHDFPEECRGTIVKGIPYTPWQLLEHMRIAQWDILEFSRDARHVSPAFPDGYWPKTEIPPNGAAWDTSVRHFRKDLEAMQKLVQDPSTDLYALIPHGDGQTILREALLVADHNAYHLGQLVLFRRLLQR